MFVLKTVNELLSMHSNQLVIVVNIWCYTKGVIFLYDWFHFIFSIPITGDSRHSYLD